MRGRTRASIAVAAGGAAAVAAARAADRRRVARDPEHAFLRRPPEGRPRLVAGAGGTRLHVEEFGPPDAPAIVLVHGWTCQLRFWAYQLRDLATEHRVIAYDLRGHGRSAAPAGRDFSTDALADDLEAVLAACLAPGERAVLAGHSLGAMTLAAWAGRHPGSVERRADGAVLVNTGMGDLISESLVLRLPGPLNRTRKLAGRAILGLAGPLPARNPISHRVIRHVVTAPSAGAARVAFCEDMVLECRHDVRAGFGRTLSRLELHDGLARLDVRAVVVAGERDLLTPMSLAERLAERLPRCEHLVRVPDCGHMAPVERPEAVTVAIRALRRVDVGEPLAAMAS